MIFEENLKYGSYNNKKLIYMKYYYYEKILELHSNSGIPIGYFTIIKKRLKKKVPNAEIRVIK